MVFDFHSYLPVKNKYTLKVFPPMLFQSWIILIDLGIGLEI